MRVSKLMAIIVMLGLALTSCNRNQNKVNIGVNLPMTGSVAYYGISAQKGIELALDQIKKAYQNKSKNISIIYEDNQGQAKEAITAMSQLISVNHCPSVIGCGSSTESMAAAPVANDNKVVLISPISSATLLNTVSHYFFRTCPTDSDQANDLAKWVLTSGYKKIAIIYSNSTWGTGFKDDFVNYYTSHNGKILGIKSSDPGATDFRSQLSVLKTMNPDALVFITYAIEGGTLVRQARQLGIAQKIFGADPWSQKDFRIGAGKYADGIMYTTPVQYNGKSFENFKEQFEKKYKGEPDVYASNGYDCMMILWKSYLHGARTGSEFQRFLQNINFTGATGITKFDGNGNVVGKHFGRFVIKNGKPSLLNQ